MFIGRSHMRSRGRALSMPKAAWARMLAAAILLAAIQSPALAAARADGVRAHATGGPGTVPPYRAGLTVSPQPGTPDASPRTQISFLGVSPHDISGVSVSGSQSGAHSGRVRAYSTGIGESFLPTIGFTAGERVTVLADVRSGSAVSRVGYSFLVGRPYRVPIAPMPAPTAGKPGEVQRFRSRPDLDPPQLTVTADDPAAAQGDIFLAPTKGAGQHGPMIVDGQGRLVYFHSVGRSVATDFKELSYDGKPVITWWQGYISPLGFGLGEHEILDSSYRQIGTVHAGNGYRADLHDFQITPRGTALLTAFAPMYVSLKRYGGLSDAVVVDCVFQEIDIRTGLVMFEWHAMRNVALTESYSRMPKTTQDPYDYFHINSVQLLADGNFLVSARNTWAAYEVSSLTGGIVWRLGGKRSTLKMEGAAQFYWQHSVRKQSDGTVTVFDDGASPAEEKQSRAEVLSLDMQHHTARVLDEYTHPSPLLADSQGNTQVLPNGNVFVGWGQVNYLSEFSSSGKLLFDAHLPPPGNSYRAFRFPWSGEPHNAPNVKVTSSGRSRLTVCVSWNGATGVASWRVLAGSSPAIGSMKVVGVSASAGFETAVAVATDAPYIVVQALDASGKVLGTSVAVKT